MTIFHDYAASLKDRVALVTDARRPVSDLYPFQSMSDVREANISGNGHWFEDKGGRIIGDLRTGYLFIEAKGDEWDDTVPVTYTVYFAAPSGEIIHPMHYGAEEGLAKLETVEDARSAAGEFAKAIKENGFLSDYSSQR